MEKGLKRFQARFPEDFKHLKEPPGLWRAVENPIGGEVDLVSQNDKLPHSLFGKINISSQLRHWLTLLPLTQVEVLVVYGLGLGYPYQALKPWLKAFSHRKVIFLEDDMDVLYEFLKREACLELLDDLQAEIRVIPKEDALQELYFKNLAQRFLYHRFFFTGIPSYQREKGGEFQLFKYFFEQSHYFLLVSVGEVLGYAKDFYQNFWGNLHKISESKLFSKLKDAFKGVPAIVVGAGPSLGKQIPLLKKLQDKALIISGGTATNVLNANGISPHLHLALDPFEPSFSRALASTSFETPVIYKLRYNRQAFEVTFGPLIYLNAGFRYSGEKWLEEILGIEHLDIELGSNVVNASCALSGVLGCNPVVTVGVDLAYTEDASYGPGIKPHALTPDQFKSRVPEEEMIYRSDVYGKPVKTLMKWVTESLWYSGFKKTYPDLEFVNATEGGIGFPGIENVSFETVTKPWKKPSFDIRAHLETKLKNASMPVSDGQLEEAMEMLLKSLQSMNETFKVLYDTDKALFLEHNPHSEALEELLKTFQDEPAWKAVVEEFSRTYQDFIETLDESDQETSPAAKNLPGKAQFLWNVVRLQEQLIERNLKIFPEEAFENAPPPKLPKKGELYHGTLEFYWPAGALRRKLDLKEGKRDGKDQFWNRAGQLIMEATYKNDLPVGVASGYTDGGRLHKEVIYDDKGEVLEVKTYNLSGELIPEKKSYHEALGEQADNLGISLESMYRTLQSAAKAMPKKDTQIDKEIKSLSDEIKHLKSLSQKLQTLHKGAAGEIATGDLKEMKQDVDNAVNQMKALSKEIEFQVKDVRKKLRE
ncbi:MAG: DUF115 domain-containing protein [Chlamydiia bacterium]|nr:DUF115 domain-containing protein [Chlamydiia bacterium]